MKFRAKCKVFPPRQFASRCYQNHLESDFCAVNLIAESGGIPQVYSTEILPSTATTRVNSTEINSNLIYGERITGLPASGTQLQKPNKLLQFQNTQPN